MSGAAGARTPLRRGLRIAASGCATLVLLVMLGAAFVAWRVGRYVNGTDPTSLAWKARLDADRTAVPGAPVDVAFDGCDLYRAARGTTDWTSVALPFAAGEYPAFMTGCTRASAEVTDGMLVVSICAQAIGAGGGCARAGTFRTHDAVTWERRDEHAPVGPHGPRWIQIAPDTSP